MLDGLVVRGALGEMYDWLNLNNYHVIIPGILSAPIVCTYFQNIWESVCFPIEDFTNFWQQPIKIIIKIIEIIKIIINQPGPRHLSFCTFVR